MSELWANVKDKNSKINLWCIVQQICDIICYDCAFRDRSVKLGALLNLPKSNHFGYRAISNSHF